MTTHTMMRSARLGLAGVMLCLVIAGCDEGKKPAGVAEAGKPAPAVQGAELGAPPQAVTDKPNEVIDKAGGQPPTESQTSDTETPVATDAQTEVAVASPAPAPIQRPLSRKDRGKAQAQTPSSPVAAIPAASGQEHPTFSQLAQSQPLPQIPEVPGYISVPFEKLSNYLYATEFSTTTTLGGGGADLDDAKLAERAKLGDKQIPDEIRALDGKKIAIVGWMFPIDFEQGQTNEFILSRAQLTCQFCQKPQINDWVAVTTVDNKRFDYNGDDPIIITGVFSASLIVKDGFPQSLYRVVADDVHAIEIK